jgi:hypothetical protein
MRRAVVIVLCGTLLGGLAALAEARGVGTSAGNFLKAGWGARPSGMGGAFVAIADDTNALEWNPAGLSQLSPNYFNASFEHVFWFNDVEYEVLSVAQYLQDTYGAGMQILYRHMPDIDNDIEDLDPLKVFDVAGIFGFGMQISNFSVGLNLKLYESRLGTEDLFGQAVDLGMLVFFLERRITLGLAIQNLGPDVQGDSLPLNIRGGFSYRETFGENKEHGLNAALEINQPLDNKLNLLLGAEYWYLRTFGVRTGFRQQLGGNDLQSDNVANRLTVGLSARWADLQLDYGFVPYAALGGTHRLALTVKYGPLKDEIAK